MFEVLKCDERMSGAYVTTSYDVTDYEGYDSKLCNLVVLNAFMSADSLKNEYAKQMFRSQFMVTWIKKKLIVNMLCLIMWALT